MAPLAASVDLCPGRVYRLQRMALDGHVLQNQPNRVAQDHLSGAVNDVEF